MQIVALDVDNFSGIC